jgi:N,N'-diacetyllegionaminate synthase
MSETLRVAEVGNCNGGDPAWADAAVDRCAAAGLWGFKIQLYAPDRLVTRDAPTYGDPDQIREPETQWDHFQQPIGPDLAERIAGRCRDVGLQPFASVFDESQLAVAMNAGMATWKIASADITHKRLIEACAGTGFPILLSAGAATMAELQRAMLWIVETSPLGTDHTVVPMACTLAYPTPLEHANVARVQAFPGSGYSDHTRGTKAVSTALAVGANVIEKHVTITPGRGGDHDFAVSPEEFGAAEPHRFPKAMGRREWSPVPIEEPARRLARRSLVTAREMRRGERFTDTDLVALRPGTGLEPWMIDDDLLTPVGQKVARGLPAGHIVQRTDFGPVSAALTVQ